MTLSIECLSLYSFIKNLIVRTVIQQIGKEGEDVAARLIRALNYEILEKNYYAPYGEIDLIALDQAEVVFIEVRTRKENKISPPEETVTFRKQQKLLKSAQHYLSVNAPLQNSPWRIDIIGIELDKKGFFKNIEHLKGAIEED